jgi:hypothetical protein
MYQRERRSTHRKALLKRRADDVDNVRSEQQADHYTFPLFAAPPFLARYRRHRKYLLCQRFHPSVTPMILLWDENADAEPELQS